MEPMTVYFEKARELADLILKSEPACNLSQVGKIFDADEEAKNTLNEYRAYHNAVQLKYRNGELSREEAEDESKKLAEMGKGLEKNLIIKDLINAEDEFNTFVAKIMNVIRSTITGETEPDCGGSCASCSGCKPVDKE